MHNCVFTLKRWVRMTMMMMMMMMMISCGCKSSWIWLLMETDDQDGGCCQQPFLLYGRPFAMREDVSKILRIHKTSLLVIWFDMICLNVLVWYDLLPAKVLSKVRLPSVFTVQSAVADLASKSRSRKPPRAWYSETKSLCAQFLLPCCLTFGYF